MTTSVGIDIGGTKCALSVGECTADSVKIVEREALPLAHRVCRICGAGLSENIGDYAALAVANM